MRKTPIEVTLTQDQANRPLAVIETSLGNGMEANPEELRSLAAALCKIADDAEARPISKKFAYSEKRQYPLITDGNSVMWKTEKPAKQGSYWLQWPAHTKGGEVVFIGKEPKSKGFYVLTFGHSYDEREPLSAEKFSGAKWVGPISLPI